MLARELCPAEVHLEPELAALHVLDAALMAARVALIAEHPDAGHLGLYHEPEPLPPIVVVAALLVDRTLELRGLLMHYRRTLDDFRAAEHDRQADFPF